MPWLTEPCLWKQLQCRKDDIYTILNAWIRSISIFKNFTWWSLLSSSEVEEKTQSWFQGLFEFTERERVVRTESFICIPSKARLVHLHWPRFFWLYFLVVTSVFVAIFFGGWFSPRNSWSALHSSDKFEKIVFSLTSDWSKMGTGSLGNLSKLQICEVC